MQLAPNLFDEDCWRTGPFCEHCAFTDESPFLADLFVLHFPFHLSTLRNKAKALWTEMIKFYSV